MYNLAQNVGAWLLAFYATYLWITADLASPHRLRDGLWVALSAILLSAWSGEHARLLLRFTPTVRVGAQLTRNGHLLLWTALLCALSSTSLILLMPVLQAIPAPAITFALTQTFLWWIGLALLAALFFWPGAWQHAALGPAAVAPAAGQSVGQSVVNWFALLFVGCIGLGTRLLFSAAQPAFCRGAICTTALQVSDGQIGGSLPNAVALTVAQLFYQITGRELLSLRLTVLLLALALLICFYLLAARLVGNGGALLGTLLVALAPWFQALDAAAFPALLLLLLTILALWLLVVAWHRHQPKWALLAGGILTLAATDFPLIQLGLLVWLLLLVLGATFSSRAPSKPSMVALLALVGYLFGALPTLAAHLLQWQQGGNFSFGLAVTVQPFPGLTWLLDLFQPQRGLDPWDGNLPLLTMVSGGATLVGLGQLMRNGREPLSRWLLGGFLLFGALLIYGGADGDFVPSRALFFCMAMLMATVAVHCSLAIFQRSWHDWVPQSTTVATGAIALVLFSLTPLLGLVAQQRLHSADEQAVLAQAMGERMATLLANTPAQIFFVPDDLVRHPALRLSIAGEELAQIEPLSTAINRLYTTAEPVTTTYLLPSATSAHARVLQQLQPGAIVEQQLNSATGDVLYTLVTVTAASQRARQGLTGTAWEQRDTGGASHPLPLLGPLLLESATLPPLDPPVTLQWSGALRVALPGTYDFRLHYPTADGTPQSPSLAGNIALQVDGRLVLDTLLGLDTQQLFLAKGFYQVQLIYTVDMLSDAASLDETGSDDTRPDDTGLNVTPSITSFAIHWQRPDGTEEIIPLSVLSNLPLQNSGLIGEYYRASAEAAPRIPGAENDLVDVRKDLLVGHLQAEDAGHDAHDLVQWRGQLAAPRTGEYLVAALTAPTSATQIYLAGTLLLDSTSDAPADPVELATDLYAESTIFLTRGWHEIFISHQPEPTAPDLQLFWQPPGAAPTPLENNYLVPSTTPLLATDRMLPLAPPLLPVAEVDLAALQSGSSPNSTLFALSYATDYWQPQRQQLPVDLPLLALENQWRRGTCGNRAEQLQQPHGIALSGVRRLLYVVDSGNRRVLEYGFDGTLRRSYTDANWEEPVAVELIDGGFPVVLDAATRQLYTLNPATGVVEQRPLGSSFYYPRGIAVDAAGQLFIADTGGARVVELAPDGTELQFFGGPESRLGRGQPTDVVATTTGLWAITAEDGRLWRLNSGGSLAVIEPTTTIHGPQLAGLDDGRLLLSDPARGGILLLAASGEPLATLALSGLAQPTGIAVATVGTSLYLAVVDTANCQLSLWQMPVAQLPGE